MHLAKKILPLIAATLITFTQVNAQSQFINFAGSAGKDWGTSICKGVDGGYLVVGQTAAGAAGQEDICLVKWTTSGTVSWTKTVGSPGFDFPMQVIQAHDSSYLVTGYAIDSVTGWDAFVMKVGSDGNVIWSKRYGGSGDEIGFQLLPLSEGGYLLVASGTSYGEAYWDGWLMNLDDDGNVVWFRTYGSYSTEQIYFAHRTQDGGFIVTGHTWGFGVGYHDVLLLKIASDGTFQWMKTYGTYADESGNVVMQTPEGGYLISGNTHTGPQGGIDNFILRTDSLGELISANSFGTTGDDILPRASILDSTHLALAGWTKGPDGSSEGWFALVNANGTLSRSRRFGGSNTDKFYGVMKDHADGFVMTGFTASGAAQGEDIFIVRTDRDGATGAGSFPGPIDPLPMFMTTTTPSPGLHSYEIVPSAGPSEVHDIVFTTGALVEMPHPRLFIPPTFGVGGDTAAIPVKLSNPRGLAGGDISITLDSALLRPIRVRKGSLTQDFALAFNVSRPDSVLVSFARAMSIDAAFEGSLFLIDCVVAEEAPDSLPKPVTIASSLLYDVHAQPFPAEVEHGTFTLGFGLKGDVNGDLHINAADAILSLRTAIELVPYEPRAHWAADFDRDGSVTSYDAVGILRAAVGLSFEPPNGVNQTLVRITLPVITAAEGATVQAPIMISGLPDMVSGTIDLGFDLTKFHMESIQAKPEFNGVVTQGTSGNDAVRVAFASSEAWNQEEAVVANLQVKVTTQVAHYLPSLRGAVFYDKFGQLINTIEFITTDVMTTEETPRLFQLHQNFPNPFNPSTTIRFDIPVDGNVRLVVYDLLGRSVRTLIDRILTAGTHQAVFDASLLPSGVYYCMLSSEGKVERRKMVLLK